MSPKRLFEQIFTLLRKILAETGGPERLRRFLGALFESRFNDGRLVCLHGFIGHSVSINDPLNAHGER